MNYEPWLSFFLTTLQKQKRHLENKLETVSKDATKLSKKARAILELFEDKPEWSISEIAETLGINTNTTAKTIKMLTNDSYLIKHGTTKGAWYKRVVK